MTSQSQTPTWFVPQLVVGCGGVGYDFLKHYIARLLELPKTLADLLIAMLRHYDTDEKALYAGNRDFRQLQEFYPKEHLASRLTDPADRQALEDAGLLIPTIKDTESGMSQLPFLSSLLCVLYHDEIESKVRRFLRQGFGSLGMLGQALSQQGYAVHQRSIVYVIFGSGGGTGPGFGQRIGEILRSIKSQGSMPSSTIIGLVPLASVYEIDEERMSRAMAINHALLLSMSPKMRGDAYTMPVLQGRKIRNCELSGLFDFLVLFGPGQDRELLSYENVIHQMVELAWQTGLGGAGVDFLSMLANEVLVTESNPMAGEYERKQNHRFHGRAARNGRSRAGVSARTHH